MQCPNCKGKGYRIMEQWVPEHSYATIDCGRCNGTGKVKPNELTCDSKPGQAVTWTQLDGTVRDGILHEWDNGTAICRVGKTDIAVRCC